MKKNYRLILASASIGRKYLLKTLHIPFQVIPSTVNEDIIIGKNPLETVQKRARAKAEDIALKYNNKPYLVIAADSMAVYRGIVYGKPKDNSEAKKFLNILSGKTHEFITGFCIIDSMNRKIYENNITSYITFSKLTDKQINRYLKITDVTGFAGAYSILHSPQDFISKIEGSTTNIVGLPFEIVLPVLEKYFNL